MPIGRIRVAAGVVLLAWTSGAIAACGEGEPANPELGVVAPATPDAAPPVACSPDLPSACPTPAPSWSGEVEAIVAAECGECHADGGVEQPAFDFSTYEGVFRNRGAILDQVYGCIMPPADAGALTEGQREALLGWLVCSAPDN